MIALYHRNFKKQYKKLQKSVQQKVRERIALFQEDEFDPVLNNHPLQGSYQGYRSININGDIRAVYRRLDAKHCLFISVDTHSNLYR